MCMPHQAHVKTSLDAAQDSNTCCSFLKPNMLDLTSHNESSCPCRVQTSSRSPKPQALFPEVRSKLDIMLLPWLLDRETGGDVPFWRVTTCHKPVVKGPQKARRPFFPHPK